MILAWFTLAVVGIFAVKNFKKTVIIWMPLQFLFNAQVAIRYDPPAMSLVLAVDFLLISLYFLMERKKYTLYNNEPFILKPIFIASFISFGLSLLFSSVSSLQGINACIKYFATSFVLMAIFQKMIATKDDIYLFIKVAFIVAFLITSLGVFESIFNDNPILDYIYFNSPQNAYTRTRMFYVPPSISGGLQTRYGMARATSFFSIHIKFGVACAFMLFFYVHLLQKKWFILKRNYLVLISIMLLAGIFTCNSKTAYIGILFFSLGLFYFRNLFNLRIIFSVIIITIVVVTYFPEYLLNFTSLFNENIAEEGGGSTIALRITQFTIAKKMFLMNPLLGNGLGSINILRASSNAFAHILGAESSWLRILPERGILGALLYIYTFIYIFQILSKSIPKKIIFSFLLGLLVMETATGLIDMVMYMPYLIVLRQMYNLEKKLCNKI